MSAALRASLGLALQTAQEDRHEYVLLEHLLFAFLHDPDTYDAVSACGADVDQLKDVLGDFFEEHVERVAGDDPVMPESSLAVRRVLHRAELHVTSCEKGTLESLDVLIAMYQEQDSHAVYFLEEERVTRLALVEYASHGVPEAPDSAGHSEVRDEDGGVYTVDGERRKKAANDPVRDFTVNLNDMAQLGQIDPIVGRQTELQRVMRTLCRRRKNNPLLVGEPGVGKTAIVEGLALHIVQGKVPEALAGCRIYALDMGAVLAGTKFRGQFEERVKAVLKALTEDAGAILFIDEMHTVVGAGATHGGAMDAANLLKPALQSGTLRCVASSTFKEYNNHIEKDRALARRFQRIDVSEPTVADTFEILKGLRSRYEEHYGVRYQLPALEAAAQLSARYMNDRFLPDKAIDVIDEAGAVQALLPPARRKRVIGARDIETIIAEMAKIPPKEVSASDRNVLRDLGQELKSVVFGQDAAIDKVTQAIKLARSGMNNPDRPIGSFLFAGPTGVGKTELSRQVAQKLGVKFIRFDMSEYSEKHSVARLIGAPPGYVGFDQGGLLTDAVIKTPHAVVLLDEVEKAHPETFHVLLQVMDHGALTDNNGRQADFRNVILIMTSNVGAKELAANKVGFGAEQELPGSGERAVEKFFLPEFRNRLDAIVHFAPLTPALIERVVGKFLRELDERLASRKVALDVTPAARRWLAAKGYDPKLGARPIARLIQTEIQEKLVDDVLFGRLSAGGVARVDVRAGELVIEAV